MDSLVPIIIMAVSYSHDVATALLAASGAGMWLLSKNYPASPAPGAERYFVRTYNGITRIAKYSLIWILAAGVPRIIVYKKYEWSDMAGDLQIVAVVIKHIVMFLLVGTGLYYWAKLGRKAKCLRVKNNTI